MGWEKGDGLCLERADVRYFHVRSSRLIMKAKLVGIFHAKLGLSSVCADYTRTRARRGEDGCERAIERGG